MDKDVVSWAFKHNFNGIVKAVLNNISDYIKSGKKDKLVINPGVAATLNYVLSEWCNPAMEGLAVLQKFIQKRNQLFFLHVYLFRID